MKNPRPYMEWVLLAQRWDKSVDYGSPITAWTPQMLKDYLLKDAPQKLPTLAGDA